MKRKKFTYVIKDFIFTCVFDCYEYVIYNSFGKFRYVDDKVYSYFLSLTL